MNDNLRALLGSDTSKERLNDIYDRGLLFGLDMSAHMKRLRLYNSTQGYHNYQHLVQVALNADEAGLYYGLFEDKRKELVIAALYHDINHAGNNQSPDVVNVNRAVAMVEHILPALEPSVNLGNVVSLIRATEYPHLNTETFTLEQKIICDADMLQNVSADREAFWVGLSDETGSLISYETSKQWFNGRINDLLFTDWAKEKAREVFNLTH